MDLQNEFKKIIRQLKDIKEIKAVYLFGSVAKKRATPISDIDICVITDKINEDLKAKISSVSSEKINLSLFWDLPINIQIRIFKEGKKILVRDEKFLSSLRSETISRFLDFKPIIKRYYKKALGMKYEV